MVVAGELVVWSRFGLLLCLYLKSVLVELYFDYSFIEIYIEAGVVAVNYGRLGNNLPSPCPVLSHLKSKKINRIRLFSPDKDVLHALRESGINILLGVPNQDIQRIGNDPAFARTWIKTNIVAFKNFQFRYVSVHIPPAMRNLNAAVKAAGIKIPVSTTIATSLVVDSDGFVYIMKSIVGFLVANRSPLLVYVYPYFVYNEDRQTIKLDFALFTANRVVSGWPSAGNGNIATIPNARTYINNLISHVSGTSGTPKWPGKSIEIYIFSLFNENMKNGDMTEKHFGLNYPDMRQVYPVTFR
ncbi:hypothetical protein MKX01_030104 [Papaver californicum]|nr:hypothetical protein MKX01_030104 [Papaver californicum]